MRTVNIVHTVPSEAISPGEGPPQSDCIFWPTQEPCDLPTHNYEFTSCKKTAHSNRSIIWTTSSSDNNTIASTFGARWMLTLPVAFGWAPLSRSSRTTSRWPFLAETRRTVSPSYERQTMWYYNRPLGHATFTIVPHIHAIASYLINVKFFVSRIRTDTSIHTLLQLLTGVNL